MECHFVSLNVSITTKNKPNHMKKLLTLTGIASIGTVLVLFSSMSDYKYRLLSRRSPCSHNRVLRP